MVAGSKDGESVWDAYTKGTRVWVRDIEHVWVCAELLSTVSGPATVQVRPTTSSTNVEQDGTSRTLNIKKSADLPPLRNPDLLIGKDDLTELSYLHEPAVLYNLWVRFHQQRTIYTYCGIVLVAINPYANLQHLYGDEMIQVYRGAGAEVRGVDPHVFGVAEAAHHDMRERGRPQSIIVTGESGAGKTVSAKFAMHYFAAVGGTAGQQPGAKPVDPKQSIEAKVLASNPIMEAIGNARTVRNDNSSRFGKFIKINFTPRHSIAGAEIRTYLLEKSRVTFQAKRERNYHVFYQMCAARDQSPLLKDLQLDEPTAFHYTAQGGKDWTIPGVNDASDLTETAAAMRTLGVSDSQQRQVFRVLAGVLLLGNVGFDGRPNDAATVKKADLPVVARLCSDLWPCDKQQLAHWFCERQIIAAGEVVRKPLTHAQAIGIRDALAKKIYALVFSWIVQKINQVLLQQPQKSKQRDLYDEDEAAKRFIGVLDIYGFEFFEFNSFEQFCINYANEKLQQQFNKHVFKLEQAEYAREGLDWINIAFVDNQPCIDVIEARPGVIDLLDEQCKIGRGTDETWLQQLTSAPCLKGQPNFALPKIKSTSFIIKHFAADVVYQIDGFIEKNNDSVSGELVETLRLGKFEFLTELLSDDSLHSTTDPTASPVKKARTGTMGTGTAKGKKTVATQFRDSLHALMSVLDSTRPHYVRCIKPNDEKAPFVFEPKRSMEQLRACGVLETVRISAAGYPSRWAYDEFARRYRMLHPTGAVWKKQPKEFAKIVCHKVIPDTTLFALGKTKVFFRTGQVALLERQRQQTLGRAATCIQRFYRGYTARRRYERMRASLYTMQAAGRAFLAWRRLHYLQMHRAALLMQRTARGWLQRVRYRRLRLAVIGLQTCIRARAARQAYTKLRFERFVLRLQSACRAWLARREYMAHRRKVVIVQCQIRRWLARRQLKRLKAEARSVGHLKKLQVGLESKIISLKQQLDQQVLVNKQIVAEKLSASTKQNDLTEHVRQLEAKLIDEKETQSQMALELDELKASSDEQLRALDDEAVELRITNEQLQQELQTLQDQYDEMYNENEEMSERIGELTQDLEEAQGQLQEERTARESLSAELSALKSGGLAQLAALVDHPTDAGAAGTYTPQSLPRPGSDSGASTMRTVDSALMASSLMMDSAVGLDTNWLQLVLKLQKQVQALQDDKTCLEAELDRQRRNERNTRLDKAYLSMPTSMAHMTLLQQELNIEIVKLKQEIAKIKTNAHKSHEVSRVLNAALEDNERRRDESAELRAMLATRFDVQEAGTGIDGTDALEEELCRQRQCRSQKTMITDLCQQLDEKDTWIADLRSRLEQYEASARSSTVSDRSYTEEPNNNNHNEHEQLDKRDSAGGHTTDGELEQLANGHSANGHAAAVVDAQHQHEIHRVVTENMVLHNKVNKQAEQLKKLRNKRGNGVPLTNGEAALESMQDGDLVRLESLPSANTAHSGLLEVFDIHEFVRLLITDLHPRIGRLLMPCHPSYLLLMALRLHDNVKDETGMTALFGATHAAVKDTVARSSDLDILTLWLVNAWCLLNLLRQYSADENPEWGTKNTERQKEHGFRNFSVSPLLEKLAARVTDAYEVMMKRCIEPLLTPKIFPALLHHNAAKDFEAPPASSSRQAHANTAAERMAEFALDDLIEFLSVVHDKLTVFGADHTLVCAVFTQMCRWLCAQALNHLMFRRDMCNFERAVQIKHNVQQVQSWLGGKGLEECRMLLEPLIQASHVLQSPKDEAHVDKMCDEMTDMLNTQQIMTLLRHYTPVEIGYEEGNVSANVLALVENRLKRRQHNPLSPDASDSAEEFQLPKPALMSTHLQPFELDTFVYSDVNLTSVTLPHCLHMDDIARVL